MKTAENHIAPREHPRRYDWIPAVPLVITLVICLLSLDDLYKIWLEPVGLHLWMEDVFPRGYTGFDKFTNDPTRYKVIFSWIILVASLSGLLVSLATVFPFYPYIIKSPRLYIFAVVGYLFFLGFFLFDHHGPSRPDMDPSRSIRSIFFTGLYSFGFWSVALSLSAFYAWNALLAGIVLTTRRLVGLKDI